MSTLRSLPTAPELEEMPAIDPADTLAEILHLWCVADDLCDAGPGDGAMAAAESVAEGAGDLLGYLGPLGRQRYRALTVADRLTPERRAQIDLLLDALGAT